MIQDSPQNQEQEQDPAQQQEGGQEEDSMRARQDRVAERRVGPDGNRSQGSRPPQGQRTPAEGMQGGMQTVKSATKKWAIIAIGGTILAAGGVAGYSLFT
jgi:hypothetical protein